MRQGIEVVALLWLAGCMAVGVKVEEGQLAQFERGKTTYYDVVARLGKPTTMVLHTDGTRHVVYHYAQSQVTPESFIPVVALFQQGTRTDHSTVVMEFAANETLVSYTATVGTLATGQGIISGAQQ